jgi:hypothetical protein
MSRSHYSFWSSASPLGGLAGAGLLVMASARLSWAIIIAGSLFWVYGLTSLTFAVLSTALSKKFFPESGKKALYACFASFWGCIYLFLFWILCPLAAIEMFLPMLLVPLFCASSGIVEYVSTPSTDKVYIDVLEHLSEMISEAASIAILLVVFAIIREPLSYCMLSFPGSYQGLMTIMYFKSNSFFPIGLFASSAGGLLLLGYFICLYQNFKGSFIHGERV